MKNNNDKGIIPIYSYTKADIFKGKVLSDNKNKSGIYRWNNKVTNKSYIGSSTSLSRRFSFYYSLSYLENKVKKGSSIIYNSLLKHGHSNFSLDILEYCEINVLIKREQYYFDLLKPKYNILNIAGSSIGFKHTVITRINMSINNTKEKHPFYGKKHNESSKIKMFLSSKSALGVKIICIETGAVNYFNSNVKAANYLKTSEWNIRKYKKTQKLYKNKYKILTYFPSLMKKLNKQKYKLEKLNW